MDEQAEHNGHQPRVYFGSKDWQWMLPEVASLMLTLFKARQPALFGAYYAEVVSGAKPKAARGE